MAKPFLAATTPFPVQNLMQGSFLRVLADRSHLPEAMQTIV
jgi:hypothetical protein